MKRRKFNHHGKLKVVSDRSIQAIRLIPSITIILQLFTSLKQKKRSGSEVEHKTPTKEKGSNKQTNEHDKINSFRKEDHCL
jgi:hypothetical protein